MKLIKLNLKKIITKLHDMLFLIGSSTNYSCPNIFNDFFVIVLLYFADAAFSHTN